MKKINLVNQKRLVNTFLELVKIDSPSGYEKPMADEMEKRLKALGGNVYRDEHDNLYAKFKGSGEPFLFNCHLDTVEPGRNIQPKVENDRIVSNGKTIVGGDAKAGLAIILEMLTCLKENNLKHIPLEIFLTVSEEIGLIGAINADYNQLTAKTGITLDGSKDIKNVTISAPGYCKVDATILGRAAHAGAEPEKGINAIKIASQIINKLKLGRIDFETTANIGLIQGGTARNSVPDSVTINGEIRSRNLKKMDRLAEQYQKVFDSIMEKHPEASIDLTIHKEFNPYYFNEKKVIIKKLESALKKNNLKLNFDHAGGGTDVNIMHMHGIEAVAVGNGAYNTHTKSEYVVIPELVQAVEVSISLATNN